MSRATIRAWFLVHKWTSIVSTAFLLMLCITGLPLIFHDEIDRLSGEVHVEGPASAAGGLSLNAMLAKAQSEGGGVPLFMAFSPDNPLMTVTLGPRPDAPVGEMRLFSYNRQTGESTGEIREDGIMHILLQLHTDMFLGLWGMIFLGVMGLFFTIAILSGMVLYVPFMRRLRFGTLRTGRSARVKWLDYHNLLGMVTLGWALVVGLTGVINAFADPLTDAWRNGALKRMVAAYEGQPPLDPKLYGSLDTAMAAAKAAQPGLLPQFIGFPGGSFSSGHHYAIFFQGDTPLTSHVLTPALVDARTGRLTDIRAMPPLNQALMLSKPLHFGDYGGLALKLLWALLDVATIWVLGSGLYLWLGKRQGGADARIAEIETGAAT